MYNVGSAISKLAAHISIGHLPPRTSAPVLEPSPALNPNFAQTMRHLYFHNILL